MLNTKRARIITAAFGSLALMLLFQNMSLLEFSELNIPEVDEDARQDQARELLGTYYRGSTAQRLEGEQYLNYLVYKKIEESMASEYKSKIPKLTQTLINESQKAGLDPIFILAVIQTESSFNPRAKGTSGEIGLMQILPPTAEWIAKKYKIPWKGPASLNDPATNVRLGITYFAHLRESFESRAYHYLPAYNMGPKNMRKIDRQIGSINAKGHPQKREYAMRVMKNYSLIYQQIASEQKSLIRTAAVQDARYMNQ